MTPPKPKTRGQLKTWRRCDVRQMILRSPEKFSDVLRQKVGERKKTPKNTIARRGMTKTAFSRPLKTVNKACGH